MGQRRARTTPTSPACSSSARVLDARGARGRSCRPSELGLAYRDSRFKHAAGRWPARTDPRRDVRTSTPADPDVDQGRLDEIRRWRQAHQPLGLPSAGSVFRNPPGDSAGRLIEAAGLKGFRIGGAVVSEKHANFIVNDQKGTAADVRRVGDHVRAVVAETTGVELVYEVEFVGDWEGWPWPA